MRLVQTRQGPFWVWDQDHLGAEIGTNITWWDEHIRPTLNEAAVRRPGTWAIDLGASVGWFTVYLAGLFKGVVAVEALPGTFELLTLNTQHLPNVERICAVAYDHVRNFRLATPTEIGWPITENWNDMPNTSSLGCVEDVGGPYRSVVLDRCFQVTSRPIGVIKCDVQGVDLQACRGLQQTIQRDRPLVVFEFEGGAAGWHHVVWEDYLAFWASLDYTVVRLYDQAWDYVARPKEG